MKVEINVKRIGKVCIIILSLIFIFPFLVVIGYYLRGYIDNRISRNRIITPLESDLETNEVGYIEIK